MTRIRALLVALALTAPVAAQEVTPEECLVRNETSEVAAAEYEGKRYEFADVRCREQFLSDPERYSQLYDALLELERAGRDAVPRTPSLVPS